MMLRLIMRVLGWFGWQTIAIWLMIWIALYALIWTIADLHHGLTVSFLLPLGLLGMLLGWSLARARFVPAWLSAGVLLGLGLEFLLLQTANLELTVISLLAHLFQFARQLWSQPLTGIWPELAAVAAPLLEIWTGLQTVGLRLLAWTGSIIRGEPAVDPVANAFAWGFGVWASSAWAGWMVRRKTEPLVALLPGGVLLVTLLAYHPREAANLLPFVGATLALMSLLPLKRLEQRWQTARTDYPDTLNTEIAFAVIPVTLLLLVLAAIVPNISVWRLARQVRTAFAPPAQSVGAPAPSSAQKAPPSDNAAAPLALREPGLPRSHLLGSDPELSEEIALIIQTGPVDAAASAPRHYWRSLTYDGYSGRGWYTGETEKIDYPADAVVAERLPHHTVLRQQVQVVRPDTSLFFAAGEIATIDQPYTIYWRAPDDPFAVTGQAAAYQVESLIPVGVTPAALRQSGAAYPVAVQSRYLRLPDTVPERVLALARDLTATAPTAYDRAKAIERYVRQFPYSLDLPEPPLGRDMVDYFLFELQRGYCDYYASAMVVLARAAGVPARLGVGYATGTYDAATATYQVTEADAHSWAEIYFPDYGWIKFEPTAAQPVENLVAEGLPPPLPEPEPDSDSGQTVRLPALGRWGAFLGGAVILLGLGGLAWLAADRWRLRRLAPAQTIISLYQRLQQAGHRLDTPARHTDTPAEFAQALKRRVASLKSNGRLESLLAIAPDQITYLTQLYVQTIYSPHPPGAVHQTEAIQIWQQLQKRLWLMWAIQCWRRWRQRRNFPWRNA